MNKIDKMLLVMGEIPIEKFIEITGKSRASALAFISKSITYTYDASKGIVLRSTGKKNIWVKSSLSECLTKKEYIFTYLSIYGETKRLSDLRSEMPDLMWEISSNEFRVLKYEFKKWNTL